MIKNVLIILLLLSFNVFSNEEKKEVNNALTLENVYLSTMANFPLILESLENVEVSKMKIKESLGAFDLKLKAKSDMRTNGYYDGRSTDLTLVKPIQSLNARLYTGYRVSKGAFPIYEGKAITMDNGEVRAGIELSLWQNRDIDSRRLDLRNNKLSLSAKELEVLKTQVKVRKQATKAYWGWVAKGNIYFVYQELLDIALEREKGLDIRIKKGDLARIYKTENNQYIVKRKSQVANSKRQFQEASLLLSLFLRDKDGIPLIPEEINLPKKIQGEKRVPTEKLNEDIKIANELSPELLKLSLEFDQYSNFEEYGLNKLKPKIDLSFEVSKDNGLGSDTLEQTENRAMLKIEIPIERRLGEGKVNKARAQKKMIGYKKQLFTEKLNIKIKSLFYRLNTAIDIINNSTKEVEYSILLRQAELKKFDSGASDFFVVNLREQNMADAKVKNIKAHLEYQKANADYQEATLAFLRK